MSSQRKGALVWELLELLFVLREPLHRWLRGSPE